MLRFLFSNAFLEMIELDMIKKLALWFEIIRTARIDDFNYVTFAIFDANVRSFRARKG